MKTNLLMIIMVVFVGAGMILFTFDDAYDNSTNSAYGMWFPLSPENLIEKSGTIFVGNVTAISTVDVEYQSQIARDGTIKDSVGPEVIVLEEYHVDVEEYLKNPQDSDTMKVLSATVGGVPSGPSRISGFEIGDRVLFYLPNDKGQTHFTNQYMPESFSIPKHCDAKSVLRQPRIDGANDFRMMQDGIVMQNNFTANKKIQFVFDKDLRTLYGAEFYVDVAISKILDKKERQAVFKESIQVESKPCEWVTAAAWEFTPTAGKYSMRMHTSEGNSTGGTTLSSGFTAIEDASSFQSIFPLHGNQAWKILPPLKQFNYGIPPEQVSCKEGLEIAIKKSNWQPLCLTHDTKEKLIQRGWAEPATIVEGEWIDRSK